MPSRSPLFVAAAAALAVAALPLRAQEPAHVGYPERDALSPFRNPVDVYAPPDEVFRLLRTMQHIADRPGAAKSYDDEGREIVADPSWRAARAELAKLDLNAGYLAQIMRVHRDAGQRALAFYGAFYVADRSHVIELIEHIPGEPQRHVREAALPRALEFLRKNLQRRFGELTEGEQRALQANMPQPGSPAARTAGIVRAPVAEDHLHGLRVVPFLQLLDVETPIDQAQALWFLKEVFRIRPDLALFWLEPSLPRVRQLLLASDEQVRREAIGLLQAIGPADLREPPTETEQLLAWADEAEQALFPPIRNLNDAIVQIHPSPARDRIAAAGVEALANSSLGDPFRGQRKDGQWFRGYRIARVPDELKPLAIPKDSVIVAVNGNAVHDGPGLLELLRTLLRTMPHPRVLLVEYVRDGEQHAIEYRLM